MEAIGRLVITRSSEWMNKARSFKVLIDGQEAGAVSNGGSVSFDLSPGLHKVFCKVDWCSSREVEVNLNAGETEYLRVQSGMKYYWQFVIPMITVIFINAFMIFSGQKRPYWFNILIGLVCLPGAGYILYYTAFNRKEYLQMLKDETTLPGV